MLIATCSRCSPGPRVHTVLRSRWASGAPCTAHASAPCTCAAAARSTCASAAAGAPRASQSPSPAARSTASARTRQSHTGDAQLHGWHSVHSVRTTQAAASRVCYRYMLLCRLRQAATSTEGGSGAGGGPGGAGGAHAPSASQYRDVGPLGYSRGGSPARGGASEAGSHAPWWEDEGAAGAAGGRSGAWPISRRIVLLVCLLCTSLDLARGPAAAPHAFTPPPWRARIHAHLLPRLHPTGVLHVHLDRDGSARQPGDRVAAVPRAAAARDVLDHPHRAPAARGARARGVLEDVRARRRSHSVTDGARMACE